MDTLKKTTRSLAAAAALGLVVAGCTSATTDTDNDGDAMMPSSSAGMMDGDEMMMPSSASGMMDADGDEMMPSSQAGDAMMPSSVGGGAMEGPSATTGAYKDGTYTATGLYTSPAGKEEVGVSVTLKGGVITASEFTGKATNPGSVRNQDNFKAGFTTQVVGKEIDAVKLTVVNGSSLTPKGFMDALAKIKAEAKA